MLKWLYKADGPQHAMLRIEQFLAKVRTLDYVDAESTASGKAGWLYGMTSRSIS